jgi:hydrogenase maturation protease
MTRATASKTVLVAGIGNIFMGDDAFGSEVARRLAERAWPDGVRVADFGIRAIDLVYALMDGYDMTILIDATQQGGSPGTLYTIEPDFREQQGAGAALLDGHTMDPVKVLRTAHAMGGSLKNILLVGCEPADLGGAEGHMGLSEPVAAVVDEACEVVSLLVGEYYERQTNLPRRRNS